MRPTRRFSFERESTAPVAAEYGGRSVRRTLWHNPDEDANIGRQGA